MMRKEQIEMKTRNCIRQAEIGEREISKNPNYDITPREVDQLREINREEGFWNAACTAFLFGYAAGVKAERQKNKKKS